jgi:hypothetical protein
MVQGKIKLAYIIDEENEYKAERPFVLFGPFEEMGALPLL